MKQGMPLYNGTLPQAARQQFVQMPGMPKVQGMGEQLDRAIDAGLKTAENYAKLHDFGEQQRVEHAARMIDVEMEKQLHLGMTAKWGTRESFFNEDGTRNEDNIAAFQSRWQEAYDGINCSYLLRDNAMRDSALMSQRKDGVVAKVQLGTTEQEFRNRREAFEANYALAAERGDVAGMANALAGAVESGQMLPAEAERRKLAFQRQSVRKRQEELRAGGGEGAAMALDELLEGVGEVQSTKDKVQSDVGEVQSDGDDASSVNVPLTLDEERLAGVNGGESEHLTLHEAMLRDLTGPQPSSVLTPAEFKAELQQSMAASMAIVPGDFKGGATISDAAPEGAKVAVAQANKEGGWTEANYKEAVYALGVQLALDPHYMNLSDKDLYDTIYKVVHIPGMEQQLFAGVRDPEAAYKSFIDGHVQNIVSVRKGGKQLRERVKDTVVTQGIELPENDGAVDYAMMRACEELGRYRMNGGSNWYEEQVIVGNAIRSGLQEYEEKGGVNARLNYARQQAVVDLNTVKACEKKAAAWEGKVKLAQENAKAEAEAKKKQKPKTQTREELLKERPYLGETELHYKYKANGERRATLTVPVAEYREIAKQFEKGDDDVLYCYINGGKTALLIIPGDTDEWTVNRPAAHVLANGSKKSVEVFAKGLMSGEQGVMTIKRVRKVGNK